MNSSPDGSADTFLSCLTQQSAAASNNNDERNFLEASDIPSSQDSDAASDRERNLQPLLTQAPAQSCSDDSDDDNDDMESDEYHSLSPHPVAASVNRGLPQTPLGTQDSEHGESEDSESPESRASDQSTTDNNENRAQNESAVRWVRPDLLSAYPTSTKRVENSPASETVEEEKKMSYSPAPGGWPLEAFHTQRSVSSVIASSSPESPAQSTDEDGIPQRHSMSGNSLLLTQPEVSEDPKPIRNHDEADSFCVGSTPVKSPGQPPSSQPPSVNKTATTPLKGFSPNSQLSDGFIDTLHSSPEGSQPSPSDAASKPSTPLQESDSRNETETDVSSCERETYIVNKDLTRSQRIQRNKDRLVELGLAEPSPTSAHSSPDKTIDDFESPTGMLLKSPCKQTAANLEATQSEHGGNIDELYVRYPHRQSQIRQLVSLIGTTMGQTLCQGNDPFVPPPIFVSGPSGSGKTSVVRDVVETLKQEHSSLLLENRAIGTAYVNCAAIEPSSLESVLESAYSQLVPSNESSRRRAKLPKRKRRKGDESSGDDPKAKQLKADALSVALGSRMNFEDADVSVRSSNDGDYDSGNESEMEDIIEESKARIEVDENNASESEDPPSRRVTRLSLNAPANRKRRASDAIPNARKKTIKKTESVTKSHGAPVAFGRVISPFFGAPSSLSPEKKPGSAFLVVDHAERLFTLSTSQKVEPNNFLAQLLLLPQVMGLNLTLIVVSRSTLLDCSRINNSAPVQKALGTVANGIRPIRVHFPAYKGKTEFKTILKQPKVVELIVGERGLQHNDPRRSFQENTIDSFIETVVQSLSSVTRDTREMIRVGRSLWPTYILPLDPRNIQTTLNTARRRRGKNTGEEAVESVLVGGSAGQEDASVEDFQSEILAILDEAILPRMKQCLEDELFLMKGVDTIETPTSPSTAIVASTPSSRCDLPYLSKCLLLAAYVCQSNKPDKDRALFTIQKNGKKNNKQGHRVGKNDGEGLAFGATTWEQQRLKMLRPRTFPLERMLSVFVNVVGLVGGEEKLRSSTKSLAETRDLLGSIGSTCFFENLARLREIGLLHEVQGSSTVGGDGFASFDGINMTVTKYWCELSQEEAEHLAASVEFPLENFLL